MRQLLVECDEIFSTQWLGAQRRGLSCGDLDIQHAKPQPGQQSLPLLG